MKLVGLAHLEEAIRRQPNCADAVRAWGNEIRHRSWSSVAAFASCFAWIDVSDLPVATFRVGAPPVRIETLIDMRTGVVLVTDVIADTREIRA